MAKRTIAAVKMQAGDEKAVVILDNGGELHGLKQVSVNATVQGPVTGVVEFVMLPGVAIDGDG